MLQSLSPDAALRYATYISAVLMLIGSYFAAEWMGLARGVFWAILFGCVVGIAIALMTEYYTSGAPVKRIANSSETGSATNMIAGLAVGMESTTLPVLGICVAIGGAFHFAGLYGIGIAAVGNVVNGGGYDGGGCLWPDCRQCRGISEMAELGPETREITDGLDALGNTTAAIGKGFAIGSAALTALALFSAYSAAVGIDSINLTKPPGRDRVVHRRGRALCVAALTMTSVGNAAFKMVEEVRRQFREIPGLMEGTGKPDTRRCVDISTVAALREMVAPGLVAVLTPVLVGFVLGAEALGGMLGGATVTGVLLALMMANSGGALDNAKKLIEGGNLGGKGSEAHKAAVVGDTVGDPLKDTSGPSLNILIKLMSVVSLMLAPLLA